MFASSPLRVGLVFGTRPEAIKLAPVVHALGGSTRFEPVVVVTGQHREMLDQVLRLFDISPTADLDVIRPRQSLTSVTTRVLRGLEQSYAELGLDVVVVQGDTTTTMAASLAAFYARLPLAHVEAGLRTGDRWAPYPEEVNRRITTQLAALHLAPTIKARENLLAESVAPDSVVVTGNTVIDALLWTVGRNEHYEDPALDRATASGRRILLVTAHRRESWGEPMKRIASAVGRIADTYPQLVVVVPMHRNPAVREILTPELDSRANVLLTEPLSYGSFARLMERSAVLLTDSGGMQEEGPSLGRPVLVMRDTTERPEAIEAGTARLVGTDPDAIVHEVATLLEDKSAYEQMAQAVNPYGDGAAARRCEQALARFLGLTDAPPDEFDVPGVR